MYTQPPLPPGETSSATPAASPAGCGSAGPCSTRSRARPCTRTAWRPTRTPASCWPAWGMRSRTSPCRSARTRCPASRRSGTRRPRWPRSTRAGGRLLPLTAYLRERGLQVTGRRTDLRPGVPAVRGAPGARRAEPLRRVADAHAGLPAGAGRLLRGGRRPAENFERQKAFTPFTALYNVSGQPAVSLPLHWNAAGLPIGVMLAGRMGDEAHADLAVGAAGGRPPMAGPAPGPMVRSRPTSRRPL